MGVRWGDASDTEITRGSMYPQVHGVARKQRWWKGYCTCGAPLLPYLLPGVAQKMQTQCGSKSWVGRGIEAWIPASYVNITLVVCLHRHSAMNLHRSMRVSIQENPSGKVIRDRASGRYCMSQESSPRMARVISSVQCTRRKTKKRQAYA